MHRHPEPLHAFAHRGQKSLGIIQTLATNDTVVGVGLLADSGVVIELRQSKYLNNPVDQDHRAVNDESGR